MSNRNELNQFVRDKSNAELRNGVKHFISHIAFDDNYKMPKQVRHLYLSLCAAQQYAERWEK